MEDRAMAEKISSDSIFGSEIAQIDSSYFNKIIELKANFESGNLNREGIAPGTPAIEMKSIFYLGFAQKQMEERFYNTDVRKLNKNAQGDYNFLLTNTIDQTFTQDLVENDINFDFREKSWENNLLNGLSQGFLQDFNSGFEFLQEALRQNADNYLIYFCVAGLKYRLVELLNSIERKDDYLLISEMNSGPPKPRYNNRSDYSDILRDLDRTIVLKPDFALAYFNRAYIKSLANDLPGAIADYQQAISLEPDLAEAYYNRGLIQIYLDNLEQACEDISKAGELGLEEAYYVIRRYCR